MKTLKTLRVSGKTVLLRVDINSEIVKGKVQQSDRFRAAASTIKDLKKKGAKVIVLAHQGNGGSLKQHAKILNRLTKIKYVEDVIGSRAEKKISKLKPGSALLLGNVRSLREEFTPRKNKMVKFFLDKVDIYVNDAFSVSHRKQTSVVSFAKYLPSAIGRTFELELKHAQLIKKKKNILYILGGAKPEDNIFLLRGRVLSTGVFSLLCLQSAGFKLGLEDKRLRKYRKLLNKIKRHKNLGNPVDLGIELRGRKEISVDELPVNSRILDIGPETVKVYKKEIEKAKIIFWKGLAGQCEDKKFCMGTKKLLKSLEKSSAYTIVAGGHSATEVDKLKINKKGFGYVSLSGGAMIHYISGKKLPGLLALGGNNV
tara:strand:- start:16 stop:1125 length:1110 start_codon:yes stop_codon:yes gene_type:complete